MCETRARLAGCWETDLKWKLYPKTIREGCEQVGKAMNMPATAVLCGLPILVSFFLAHSVVEVPGTDWVEPVILWVSVGMPTESGKSSLFNYLLGLRKVRAECDRSGIHPPWTVDETSFEKMGAVMADNHGKLLGIYDELSSFLTSLNLYRSKGLSDTHDLAVFLQLYNGHPWTRRTVTGEANFTMDCTERTVGGFTQPSMARTLIEQHGSSEKGLCQRFLWVFPRPAFGKFISLEPVRPEFTDSIVTLLTNLWKSGGGDRPLLRKWTLPQPCPEFELKYDEIQDQLQEMCGLDELLTGILSKSKGQILRVSTALHVLFAIDSTTPPSQVLSTEAIKAAIDFVGVCGEQAALLAGRKGVTSTMLSPQEQSDDESTAGYCLSLQGPTLDLTQLLNAKKFRGRGNKPGAIRALKLLEGDGLGKLESRAGRGTDKVYVFRKRLISDDKDDKAQLASKLMRYGMSLPAYSKFLEDHQKDIVPSRTSPRKTPKTPPSTPHK